MAKSFTFNPFTGNFDAISEVTIGTANGLSITSGQALSLALSSTSTTGALSSTDWNTFNGKQAAGNYLTALTGDGAASGPGSAALTLATVNSNVGSFGSASSVATFTVNAKGLTTAAGSTSIQIAESQVTNLVTDLAGKQASGNYITDLTGDVTASGPGSAAATIGANKVVNTMIRQSGALSVVGNSTNATANVADIAAATTGNVLRRSGTALGFGSLDLTLSGTVGSSILGIANGGTGQATKAPAFDALSPMTTSGDIIYGGASGTGTRLAKGSDGQVLTLASGVPSWATNGAAITSNYFQGFMVATAIWTSTSTSFVDPTISSGSNTLTTRVSNGLTVTAAASNKAGITWTPSSATAVYLVTATFGGGNQTVGDIAAYQLTDGTNIVTGQSVQQGSGTGAGSAIAIITLTGVYAPASGSAVTLKIQSSTTAGGAGTAAIRDIGNAVGSIQWSVVQIVA